MVVIDLESLSALGRVIITSYLVFLLYVSEMVTDSLSPELVTFATFPIILAIVGASGQSALSTRSSMCEKNYHIQGVVVSLSK